MGIAKLKKGNNLSKKGKIADGVIFKNVYTNDGGPDVGAYFPVVRFLTEDQTWITQKLEVSAYPFMREGKKVRLIYDPSNPSNVTFYSKWNLEIIPIGVIGLGLAGVFYGVLNYIIVL